MLNEFRSQNIIWDKAHQQFYNKIEANSGDSNGRKLVVQILNNGVPEKLLNTTLSLAWKTHHLQPIKGLDIFTPINIEEGLFEIYYTREMLASGNIVTASLVLIDSIGRIESDDFKIRIFQSVVDDEAIQSDNSFTTLTQALVNVQNLETIYDTRLSSVETELTKTQSQFDIAVGAVTIDSEVVLARDTHTTLKERLDSDKAEFTQHKLDYTQQLSQNKLKVASIEKNINDYQSTIANVNVNQEAKQSVTGYGVVSLPKNTANGQVG